MNASPEHALYRIRRTRRDGVSDRRYRGSWELSDDATKQALATCDLMGRVVFGAHEIVDHAKQAWRLAANRAVMPSHWLLTDPEQRLALQFHQQILRKLINPWRRTALVLLDADDRERFRLIDARTGLVHRILGLGIDEWVVMEHDRQVARLVSLPKENTDSNGVLKRLGKLLSPSDQGIASAGFEHALPAPAALALLMLAEELTKPSAAG
jgi:hypothetical protein